jgi:cell division septal protein FtsQ
MAKKRKTNVKRTASSVRVKGGRSRRSAPAGRSFGGFVLPLALITLMLGVLRVVGVGAYRTFTTSDFFDLRSIDVRGAQRTPIEDVKRIVTAGVEKPGVWNADLSDVRAKIEKFPFVKSASVSMSLPAGVRVYIVERVPIAIVHLSGGNYLVDNEGTVLVPASPNEKEFPFIMQGWDETKSEKAGPDNLARLKLYSKMVDEWKQFDLTGRVKEVSLANIRQPVAYVEDSGRSIPISVAKDNLGKSLKSAIEALAGKGAKIKSVNADGIYPVIQYLDF